jgi:hypothetical protein
MALWYDGYQVEQRDVLAEDVRGSLPVAHRAECNPQDGQVSFGVCESSRARGQEGMAELLMDLEEDELIRLQVVHLLRELA